jgi:hypothetical protein
VEVCKSKSISPHHKRLDKTAQTRPIRPIVNWRNAPAYKLSQLLTTKIKQFASLPYAFNVKNSTELIQELKQTPIMPTTMFASIDITNMYSNIPCNETKQIKNMLSSNMTCDELRNFKLL